MKYFSNNYFNIGIPVFFFTLYRPEFCLHCPVFNLLLV